MVKKGTVETVQDILQYIDEAMKENGITRSSVEPIRCNFRFKITGTKD